MPEAIAILKTGIAEFDRQPAQLLAWLDELKGFDGKRHGRGR